MAFIKGPKPSECVFCQKSSTADKDEENFVLKRGKTCFAILNLYPYSTGHVLIIPYRHTSDFAGLTNEESCEMIDMAKEFVTVISKTLKPEGFNLGMNLGKTAGAGIAEHLHLHIVPRWDGDNNFMPVVGNVKVHPTDLPTIFKQLKEYL
jgi:ATP adenylyltransferase